MNNNFFVKWRAMITDLQTSPVLLIIPAIPNWLVVVVRYFKTL